MVHREWFVQHLLEQRSEFLDIARNQLVQELNAEGIRNVTSERSGKSIDWTVRALDPVRKAAMWQIA